MKVFQATPSAKRVEKKMMAIPQIVDNHPNSTAYRISILKGPPRHTMIYIQELLTLFGILLNFYTSRTIYYKNAAFP
jgi:hypothetical protein